MDNGVNGFVLYILNGGILIFHLLALWHASVFIIIYYTDVCVVNIRPQPDTG